MKETICKNCVYSVRGKRCAQGNDDNYGTEYGCWDWEYHDIDEDPEMKEVKHGHWEDSSNGWTCSNCGRDSTYDTEFCPHCGATMDEKVKVNG